MNAPDSSAGLVFRRYAGSLQVEIPDFAALVTTARTVRDALWVATACPTEGLTCDGRFLELIDTDHNKRVRVEELKAAIEWTVERFADTSDCDRATDVLSLDRLSGKATLLSATAALVLEVSGRPGGRTITLAEVRAADAALRKAAVNGDGIVAAESMPEALQALAKDVLTCFEPPTNRAGLPGITRDGLVEFEKRRVAALEHLGRRPSVMVWGDDSLGRAKRLLALRGRIDEFFLQCRLVASQPDLAERLRLSGDRIDGLLGDAEALQRSLGALPIARPNARAELVWSEVLRTPLWESVDELRRVVVEPAGRTGTSLSEAAWRELVAIAEAIVAWQATVDGDAVFALGDRLGSVAAADIEAIGALCDADLAYAERLGALEDLERLVLYQRWLLELGRNFISMPDLYHPKRMALFQRGTLVLAGREFSMAVSVPDHGLHSAVSGAANTCLAYVQVSTGRSEAPYEVAVPITAGTSKGIETGKRGIFRDHEGKEFDAVITSVVRQPVSILEAVLHPFTRIGAFIGSKIDAMGAAGDSAFDEKMQASWARGAQVTATAQQAGRDAAPAEAPAPAAASSAAPAGGGGAQMGGLLVGGGVAIAALGSSLAFVANQLREVTLLQVLQVIVAIFLAIALPVGVSAWFKLRRRNLAVVLEGSGWALNDRLLLTRDLGLLLTRRPARPRTSRIDRADQVAQALSLRRSDELEEDEAQFRWYHVVGLLFVFALLTSVWWGPALRARAASPAPAAAEGSASAGSGV